MSEPCHSARLLDRNQVRVAIVLLAASIAPAHAGEDAAARTAAAQRAPAFCANGGAQLWANLAACGWPGRVNTGVPAGTSLRNTTGRAITRDNTVINGERINGQLIVRAKNVTIRNSSISWDGGGANASGVIKIEGGYSATISHVEINGKNHTHACIWHEGAKMTADAVNCYGVGDGIFAWSWWDDRDPGSGDHFTITNSYVHDLTPNAANGHMDGFQTTGASHGVIRHNTFDVPRDANSAIGLFNGNQDATDILVEDNLLAGGGFTLYGLDYSGPGGSAQENVPGSAAGGNSVRDIRFVNNKFSTNVHPHTSGSTSRCVGTWGTWFYRGGWPSYYGGPTDLWNQNRGSLRSGNVVIETGENIDRGGPAGCEGANTSPPAPTCQGRRITDWRQPFSGGPGRDVVLGTANNDLIYTRGGDDFVCAGAGNDRIIGGIGNDRLLGGLGNDTFFGGNGTGADLYNGGDGNDTMFFDGTTPITVSLGLTGPQNTGQGMDTLVSIENAVGSTAGDRLTGGAGANRLEGRRGADILLGLGGTDTLYGGDGNDTLGGGPGAGDNCSGGAGTDLFAGGSRAASGCETANENPGPNFAFPNATNTGVPAGVVLNRSGSITINTAGAIVSGLDVTGSVVINAPNVTLRNVRVKGTSWGAIVVQASGAKIEDCEVSGVDPDGGTKGVMFYENATGGAVRRCDIHDVEDGVYISTRNVVVEDNYIHDLDAPTADPHYDGIQLYGGVTSDVIIRHNAVIVAPSDNSAVTMGTVQNVQVEGNRLHGGGYTVYVDGRFGEGAVSNVSITNNRLGPHNFGYFSFSRSNPRVTGNVDDATGRPVP
jgi:Ca2+-binding RTX toxin-like protein